MKVKYDEYFAESLPRKDIFKAGQESRQAEINELQKNFNNALKTIEVQQRFLDDADAVNKRLTKRIDEALRFYNEAKSSHNIGMIQMAIYLKGQNND